MTSENTVNFIVGILVSERGRSTGTDRLQ